MAGDTDFDDQIGHAVKELNGPERRAAEQLRNAKTVFDAARGASMFERAEHYNRATGIDDFTMRTPVGKVLDNIRRSANHPVVHAVREALHGADLRRHFGHRTPLRGQEVDAGGLLRASRRVDLAALHKVTGEASLHVKLGPGLVPVGGVNTKGDLFKEVHLDRGAVAYARTDG
jgi:hypothetical protein